jgi:S-adenosylmethionine uptake transporter
MHRGLSATAEALKRQTMTRDHPLLPYAVTLAAVGLFSLMDAMMKEAALAVGAFSALLLRNALGLALIGPVWLARRRGWPGRAAMRIHLVRGVVASAMAFTFFWGIARIPLAEGIALSFVAPLIALHLAALLLGERIRPGAIGASLVGLAGVAVITFGRARGGGWSEDAGWGTGSVLVSSLLYAWNLVLQRQQALAAGPLEVAAFQTGVVCLVLLVFAPLAFAMPARETWPAIAAAAALALAAVLLLAWSYARAEAQALVPLEYSGFLWAALFGWLFFAERVTLPVLLGAGLIVGACWIAAPKRPTEQTAA